MSARRQVRQETPWRNRNEINFGRGNTSNRNRTRTNNGRYNVRSNSSDGFASGSSGLPSSRFHINNNDQNQSSFRPTRRMGFKAIQKLLENEDLEDVIFQLNNDKRGFRELLEDRNMKSDIIVSVMKLLGKISTSGFQNSIMHVLETALRSQFAETLVTYISKISIQDLKEKKFNDFFWKDPDDFWENLILTARTVHDIIPTFSCEVVLKILKAANIYIPVIETSQSIHISDDIKCKMRHLQEVNEKTLEAIERKHDQQVQSGEVADEPPDDFREIDVYPSVTEITYPDRPYLRRNIVDRPYDSVNQYLDIQFRLLREDFVRPLREGICKYIKDPQTRKIDDVKIYNVVRFLCMENVNEQNCYRIQFDFNKKRKKTVNYQQSRRFMFGSLLCFTSDNFVTIIFGKVVNREIRDLEKSQLIVGFDENVVLPPDLLEVNFLMVESTVFFEPYYQVLSVLKRMDCDRFPMERYIIKVQTDVRPPDYLLNIDPQYYTIENETFWPLDWRKRQFYGLNDSQQRAFEAALTQEFVIIQGPPGTGKTFLGLKIARTLIENSAAWYNNSPILVICFTNHALDQFLEGLIGVSERIVRVGSQSKNKNLEQFNLKHNRHRSNPAVSQKRREVRSYLSEIQSINESLRIIEEGQSLLDFNIFTDVIPKLRDSKIASFEGVDIIEWLFSGINTRDFHNERESDTVVTGAKKVEIAEENVGELPLEFDENLDVDEVFENICIEKCKPLLEVKKMEERCRQLDSEAMNLYGTNDWEIHERRRKLLYEYRKLNMEMEYMKYRLSQYTMDTEIPEPDYYDVNFPYRTDHDSRWQLYFHWLSIYVKESRKKKDKLTNEFKKIFKVFNELRDIEDVQVMKGSLVVGMTTTGAARLRTSLQTLKSPIVIVEEAAEVLEAHIITSITNYCQHLILIGDHQQLKPSTANFKIETDYLLGISLFERMVLNKIQCYTLDVQHRMRPEISSLICPMIYPHLKDHESVMNRPTILGVEKSLFFIDHQEREDACNDNSKKNVHEAQFLIQLARHLVLNNYKPENITILAAYLGQMFEIMHERRNHLLLEKVRIAVLDNYQGEESDIILLSLVRNNDDNKIGFLKTENRVCVALSRARNGFYIMGNITQLTKASDLWEQIRDNLTKQNSLGPYLSLQCQVHRHKFTQVQYAKDFHKFPEGGCDLFCESSLVCGHVCTRLCHVSDREHKQYNCQVICNKVLCTDAAHVCTKYCYQECGPCYYQVERQLECGHTARMECHVEPLTYNCTELVLTKLPCDHEANKPCYMDLEKFMCPHPCRTRVEPCGHACTYRCHLQNDPDHIEYKCTKPCDRVRIGCTVENEENRHLCPKDCHEKCMDCEVMVRKQRTKCPHFFDMACNLNVDEIECRKPCTKTLPCGHKCKNKCNETCGNCSQMVEKIVPDCGHKIKIKCCLEADRKYCSGVCPRILPCGHACTTTCQKPCTTFCKVMVECSIQSPCGHIVKKIECHLRNTDDPKVLKKCTEKCNTILKCTHPCPGSCGKCYQGRFHESCNEKCGIPLICNHECTIPCRQNCRPCTKRCNYDCGHAKCGKPCGVPCTPCKERCRRECSHQKCTRRCGEICNVPPCTKICNKTIKKCGHPCVGFCGDPCPILCRICDNEELTDILLGNEDNSDAIYVMLEDCKHIFESTDLDKWMSLDGNEIEAKVCPRCKATIKKSRRYNDILKRNMQDIINVKKRSFGNTNENEQKRYIMEERVRTLESEFAKYIVSESVNFALKSLKKRLQPIKYKDKQRRTQIINRMDLQTIETKTQILEMILEIFEKNDCKINGSCQSSILLSFIITMLMRDEDSITDQTVEDITMEVHKISRCIQFQKIQNSPKYLSSYASSSNVKTVADRVENIINKKERYSLDNQDEHLKNQLEELKKLVDASVAIIDAERKQIVGALKLTPGHWFKCANGHPYIITECGGAMETSNCNECGVLIGGRNHQLMYGSRHAGEMDNSAYAAWSETANLANYGGLD